MKEIHNNKVQAIQRLKSSLVTVKLMTYKIQ